mmetsp:Transcript_64498/g.154023  ORF Transcript_64498/g.154023 Transcript_64498/m.154023 type:complete len:98 (-) Transcript_64498:1221-1514(-)
MCSLLLLCLTTLLPPPDASLLFEMLEFGKAGGAFLCGKNLAAWLEFGVPAVALPDVLERDWETLAVGACGIQRAMGHNPTTPSTSLYFLCELGGTGK